MALSRLLLIICALLVLTQGSYAQFDPTSPKEDGIVIMDALGRFFSANDDGIGAFLFEELISFEQKFGFTFPVLKDLETVAYPDGRIKGGLAVDSFGGQFSLNTAPISPTSPVPSPVELANNSDQFNILPYFGFDVVEDLEIAPDWRDVTHGFKGYYILDADGVIHTVGETNLPQYAFFSDPSSTDISNATIFKTLYPNTINTSGSTIDPTGLLQGGPLQIPVNRPFTTNQIVNSVTPIFTYFGFGSDIARDLDISVEYAVLTTPFRDIDTGEIVEDAPPSTRRIAMTNGYYILDGFGAVHSNRLPLDFDTNNDGVVNAEDLYSDVESAELNPDFGTPINNAPISVPWVSDVEDLPYFGSDVAVDIEITPSGRGFYLLDVFGGVFAVGDANFTFPPVESEDEDGSFVSSNSRTPYFGFPIARDLTLVPNEPNPTLGLNDNNVTVGYLILDGFGTVHNAGLAKTFDVSDIGDNGFPVTSFSDTFRSVEISPKTLINAPQVRNFTINGGDFSVSVAPGFRNVTASFSTVSAPQ